MGRGCRGDGEERQAQLRGATGLRIGASYAGGRSFDVGFPSSHRGFQKEASRRPLLVPTYRSDYFCTCRHGGGAPPWPGSAGDRIDPGHEQLPKLVHTYARLGVVTALTDLFPETERTLYEHSPLTQVICQVRFPTLLRIESDAPAAFQERVRSKLPIFERQAAIQPGVQLPFDLSRLIGAGAPAPAYVFRSESGADAVALTPDALTLTTTAYTRWESFRDLFNDALKALVAIYAPSFFSRVGLRYQNVVNRTLIDLAQIPWTQLIRGELLGEFADEAWMSSAADVRRVATLKTSSGSLLFQHGLAQSGNPDAYVIDIDLFTESKTETVDAEEFLDKLHSFASRAFRWSITDRLHHSLGPRSLDAHSPRQVA
jgi:uncharacterized protein (TIGR04255 family)